MTYQLNTGIPDDLATELKSFAEARGISIAAAVRVILHEKLKKESSDGVQRS